MASKRSFSGSYLRARLKLHHLEFALVVGEERSLSRAAQRQGVSQPAATKTLREMELLLGLKLFERSRSGVTPTSAGLAVLRTAHVVLDEVRHLGDELRALESGATGRLVVGTLISASAMLLPDSLARLRSRAPGLTVRVLDGTFDRLLPLLATGAVDLVLGRLPRQREREPTLSAIALYEEANVFVVRVGHPLLSRRRISLGDIAELDWILPARETMLREDVNQLFLEAGLRPPRPAVESVSMLVNHRLVAGTDLLAVLPEGLATSFITSGTLERLRVDTRLPLASIGIMARSDRPMSAAGSLFAEVVRETAEKILP